MTTVPRQGAEMAAVILKQDGNAILRLAYTYLKNTADAEDLLQDTLVQYLRYRPVFESDAHRRAWLLRVCANLCKNRLKTAWFTRQELPEDYPAAVREDPESFLVLQAVQALPVDYREVIHLFYYEGYGSAEIAAMLGKKDSTVRSLLLRGRKRLKEMLKEAYDFEEV